MLTCRPLREDEAESVVAWRYPGPYASYDRDPRDPEAVDHLLGSDSGYHALLSESGELIAYFCVGENARIPGGVYDDSAVDLGMGVRPDLAGRGNGSEYLDAVLRFVARLRPSCPVRATVAAWNKRALRVGEKAGFRQVSSFGGFRRAGAGRYVVLVR